ncbi:MAG: murein L,D-transpeptidase catalytic domain-containing protein, partial [Bacteroidota bacterium]
MILLRFILAFFPLFCLTDPGEVPEILSDSEANYDFDHLKKNASHYDSLINSKAIVMGKFGYEKLRENTNLNNILLVIDFTKPSDHKRMYIIDMNSDRLLHESHVAHGKNSGLVYPTAFSNEKNTNRSSLGFYRTAETYFG